MNRKIREKESGRLAYEKHYLKADDSKFWVNVTVSSVRDEQDRKLNYLKMQTEIWNDSIGSQLDGKCA